jgi:hypothetical protein
MDLEQVKAANKDTVVLTIITNTADKLDKADLSVTNNSDLKVGTEVLAATLK